MTQKEKILLLLLDGNEWSNWDLIKVAYKRSEPSSARLAARIHELKADKCRIVGKFDKLNKKKYWYRLTNVSDMRRKHKKLLLRNSEFLK